MNLAIEIGGTKLQLVLGDEAGKFLRAGSWRWTGPQVPLGFGN